MTATTAQRKHISTHWLTFAVLLAFVVPPPASGDEATIAGCRLDGHVVDASGAPVPGITVRLEAVGAAGAFSAQSEPPDGAFTFPALPRPGSYRVVPTLNGEPAGPPVAVSVEARKAASVTLLLRPSFLDEVTVTDSREATARRESATSIGTVSHEDLTIAPPSHPREALDRVAGVWVSQTSGEGHQTAIRQPLTTSPVYLFLEDGVPTRSTGFFNHNALYEVNVPQAEAIEVTRGPGSALYGSDAIGGVVNVLTRSPFARPAVVASAEGGSFGWRRGLVSARLAGESGGLRVDANLTASDGFRDDTSYTRRSFTARFDTALGSSASLKTVATYSTIDQQTAGSSPLRRADFEDHPTINLTPISFRDVQAFRLSTEYTGLVGETQLSVIGYARGDRMDILPNWSLTYDPTRYTSENRSLGLLTKVHREWSAWRTHLVGGVDLDHSPGSRDENAISPSTTTLPGGQKAFTSYRLGPRIYLYDVTYGSAAPYLQVETSPLARLRVTAGLRWDLARYDYEDRLTTPDTPRYRRPESTSVSYRHLSPKLGVSWEVSTSTVLFASYRHAFRVPSEGQLFRQGSALDTVGLEPVKAESFEAGLRVAPSEWLAAELALYRLDKRDDILSFKDPVDGATQAVNAGKTRHQGVELQARARLASWAHLDVAWSLARHTYEDWAVDPARGVVYSGKEMENAPRQIGAVGLTVTPAFLGSGAVTLEWTHLGRYWMDAANTHSYEGHDLLSLRGSAPLGRGLRAWLQVRNVTDRRFAEAAGYTLQRGEELAPGEPRAIVAGVELAWGR